MVDGMYCIDNMLTGLHQLSCEAAVGEIFDGGVDG